MPPAVEGGSLNPWTTRKSLLQPLASLGLTSFFHLLCPLLSLIYLSLIPSRAFPDIRNDIRKKKTQARVHKATDKVGSP